VSIMHELVSF